MVRGRATSDIKTKIKSNNIKKTEDEQIHDFKIQEYLP
jgi:hypothetical protein